MIRLADTVLVLADGRLAERGSHDELMELGGEYSRLWSLQQASAAEISEAT